MLFDRGRGNKIDGKVDLCERKEKSLYILCLACARNEG